MKSFCRKYGHALPVLLFGAAYLIGFALLENRGQTDYRVVHMAIDDFIPFCEIFVVPYLLWFFYVPAVLIYLFFRDRKGYRDNAVFLCTGMAVFLVVSALCPNVQHLRLEEFPRDNVFTRLIGLLWKADTPTNLFPSIHVYNSLGAHLAVMHSETLSKNKRIRIGSLVLCVSVILSTMLIKQHSAFDVLTAFLMAAIQHAAVYSYDPAAVRRLLTRRQGVGRIRKRSGMG